MRITSKEAMRFAVDCAGRVNPVPNSDAVMKFLEAADEVNAFFAARSMDLKGVISDQAFTAALLDMLNCEIGCGLAVLPSGELAVLDHGGELINIPGHAEARAHAEKLAAARKKETVDVAAEGQEKETEAPA